MEIILHKVRGLGGKVLKTNLNLERAKVPLRLLTGTGQGRNEPIQSSVEFATRWHPPPIDHYENAKPTNFNARYTSPVVIGPSMQQSCRPPVQATLEPLTPRLRFQAMHPGSAG
jgi:hypothetical protein